MDVQIKNLTMTFDTQKAVDDLSATIHSGEMVSLLGPSGCGKSTTLMLLAGLHKPTSGEILFGGKDVTKIEAEHRGIGMVFQNYALYPHFSVLKNILFPLKMLKVPKKEALERAMDMAKMVQIEALIDRKPSQLSGGQQQRVAIARALVKRPNLLLLDEPLSNLDARLRLEMREEIRRIQLEVGITAIFVTHDQEEAMSISDRIMLMKDGKLQQESTPQEMYRRPVNLFAAKFIGAPPINILIRDDETLGIRPEHLYFTEESPFFTGTATHIENIGKDTIIRIKSDSNATETLLLITPAETTIKLGDPCKLGVKPENIHHFDTKTEERKD
ncbi:MAG: ABC transporter ATP-binding protein [Turicibacter sp.]|nr:ABC transporter ATP-binding protein [Turicibacter sp.]